MEHSFEVIHLGFIKFAPISDQGFRREDFYFLLISLKYLGSNILMHSWNNSKMAGNFMS